MDEISQAEKRAILKQDRGTTFFERSQLDLALESQGRFRNVTSATVVGATPHAVPRMPANSPWATGIDQLTGKEPPLGYSINEVEQESVPASGSLADEVGDAGVGAVTPNDGLVEAIPAPLTLSAEAKAERAAALKDRMLQIRGSTTEDASPQELSSTSFLGDDKGAREPALPSTSGGAGSLPMSLMAWREARRRMAPAPCVWVRDLRESRHRISVLERMASSVGLKRGNGENGMIGCLGRDVSSRR